MAEVWRQPPVYEAWMKHDLGVKVATGVRGLMTHG